MNEKILLGVDTSVLLSNFEFKKVSEFLIRDDIQGNTIKKQELVKSPDSMYRIVTKYGNSFVLHGDNNIILFNSLTDTLSSFKINDILNNYSHLSIFNTTIEFNNLNILLPINPYLFGYLLRIRNKRFIRFNIRLKENILSSITRLKLRYFIFNDYILVIISKKTSINFKKNDFIPAIYKKNSISVRQQLAAGIIDGGSSEGTGNKFIEIKNIMNKKLLNDFYYIFSSIGINLTSRYNSQDKWIINLFGSDNLSKIPLILKNYSIEKAPLNHFKIIKINVKEAVLLEITKNKMYSIVTNDFFML
jgi:hypothetical protein